MPGPDGGRGVNTTVPTDSDETGEDEDGEATRSPLLDIEFRELQVDHPLVAAFRHDVHKLRGRRHGSAADEAYGVAVNESVPLDADKDAALLGRPRGAPDETVDNHVSPFRLSLLTGEAAVETRRIKAAANGGFEQLVTPTDPETLHAWWVTSQVPAGFNESVYYPTTSLKFHVLLVAALLDNYRAGYAFDELFLAVSPTDGEFEGTAAGAIASDVVEPFRTVLWTPEFVLHVTGDPDGRPAAALGARSTRCFADVWARLPAHPIDTGERSWRILDARLRRLRSGSTALQYIEEYVAMYGEARAGTRGDVDA